MQHEEPTMSLLERVRVAASFPTSPRNVPPWARLLAIPIVMILVLLGVWLTGAVLTNNATLAMVLTGAWFTLAGGAALAAGLRWRDLAVPVIGTWFLTSLIVGGFLMLTSSVDKVVDETVIVAGEPSARDASPQGTEPAVMPSAAAATQPVLLSSGPFRSAAHETTGQASLIELPTGDRVLTLTDFETDPGPDLRVYLVPSNSSITERVDLGGLKGNKGDQQYDVPANAPIGAVVVWCRAFSVEFGSAMLQGAQARRP
jgi:hypothetical protein